MTRKSINAEMLAKVIAVCMIIFHLILMALAASGQTPFEHVVGATNLLSPLTQKSKARIIYNSQVGVREKGVNSGREVEKYLRYVNLPKGNPWCAAFVCWVFGEAKISNPRSGWSPALFGERHIIWPVKAESGKLKAESGWAESTTLKTESLKFHASPSRLATNNQKPATPSPGDVFGLYFPEKGRIAHVGFVDEWKDPWVTTVEGNTNVLGSREGDGVYRKRRLTRSIYKVARYVN